MPGPLSAAVWDVLVCPMCRGKLRPVEAGARCEACDLQYGRSERGALDLRLPRGKEYPVKFSVGPAAASGPEPTFLPLPSHPSPEVDFTGVPRPYNVSNEFLSHFPKARSPQAMILDLGCGDAIHRPICTHAGYEWVGIDFADKGAPILADAHSLPFADGVFACVLTVAVFEHLKYPFVAIEELHRVLEPGGRLLGSVAFLEPFHGDSYYHHSHLGTLNVLRHGGFTVEHVAPFVHWTGLLALARMGLFPRMPLGLASLLITPLQWIHLLWWKLAVAFGRTSADKRLRTTTAAFAFIATR